MIRTGIALLALFAVAQANLVCHVCSWPRDGESCKDGRVEYENPSECGMQDTHCVWTKHTNEAGELEGVDRACIGGDKMDQGCEPLDGGESCTEICNDRDGCNAPRPTDPPTTPATTPSTTAPRTTRTTTTTTAASGAGDVTVSRLVVMVAGALTALMCLKF